MRCRDWCRDRWDDLLRRLRYRKPSATRITGRHATPVVAVGGTASETLAALDALSVVWAASVSLAEAGALADVTAATSSLTHVDELLAGADAVSALTGAAVSLTEAGSAAETVSALAGLAVTGTETGTAADTVSDVAGFKPGASEAAAAADSLSVQTAYHVTVAESGAATDSANVPGSAYPNLPAGMSIDTAHIMEFTTATMNGWTTDSPQSSHYNIRDASTYSPGGGVTAPANPQASPPEIGEMTYPAGWGAGSAPGHVFGPSITGNGWKHLYVCYTVQLSSNWYGNSSGTNKIGYVWLHSNPTVFLVAHGPGAGGQYWELDLQNVPSNPSYHLNANVGSETGDVTLGLWQRIEIELICNTPGTGDGVFRMWMTNYASDGSIAYGPTKIAEYTNVEYAGSGQSTSWESITWYPVWGGTSGSVPAQQYMWIDRIAYAGATS